MKHYTQNDIIEKLNAYTASKKKIAILRYEMEHPAQVAPDEMIDAMSFGGHDESAGRPAGTVSNKTMYIALHYEEKAKEANQSVLDDIAKRLFPLEREVGRLEYYLKLLEERQREVIDLCYFERLSLQATADRMALSVWSIRALKAEALTNLTRMYNFAQGVEAP